MRKITSTLIPIISAIIIEAVSIASVNAANLLNIDRGIFSFVRYSDGTIKSDTETLVVKAMSGSVDFRVEGLPAWVSASPSSGTADANGTVVTLRLDRTMVAQQISGSLEGVISVVNADEPTDKRFRTISYDAVGSVSRGASLFANKCQGCHDPRGSSKGPALTGVYGRKSAEAAAYAGYTYSLHVSNIQWRTTRLRGLLTNPGNTVYGTSMPFSSVYGLVDSQRNDLIAYLDSVSP
jgi:cytochrome c2